MMLDVLDACGHEVPAWKEMGERVRDRARRFAAILERLIAPDGSFPAVGRSIAYRCGAFQLLAQMALARQSHREHGSARLSLAGTHSHAPTMQRHNTVYQRQPKSTSLSSARIGTAI
jgi:hypothetical protein